LRVMIIGGSNASPRTGWASILKDIAPDHAVDNRFLGGVGSLFGLLRLLEMLRRDEPRPDAVIFEYTLNDTVWLVGDSVSWKTVQETLHDVMTICARERIGLLFLCLFLRPREGEGKAEASLFLDRIYREAAQARGAATLFMSDILGDVGPESFIDPKHLDLASSRRVAESVAARLRAPLPVPSGAARKLRFAYLDASRATLSGKATLARHTTPVFEGAFVELSRGGKCAFDAEGRLAALLLRSTENSGFYSIRAGGRAIRKNAQSLARANVRNLIALHYVVRDMPSSARITIEMTRSETALMAQPLDMTLMEGEPLVPFEDQTLEIAGIMVYRPRSWLGRVIDRLVGR